MQNDNELTVLRKIQILVIIGVIFFSAYLVQDRKITRLQFAVEHIQQQLTAIADWLAVPIAQLDRTDETL